MLTESEKNHVLGTVAIIRQSKTNNSRNMAAQLEKWLNTMSRGGNKFTKKEFTEGDGNILAAKGKELNDQKKRISIQESKKLNEEAKAKEEGNVLATSEDGEKKPTTKRTTRAKKKK